MTMSTTVTTTVESDPIGNPFNPSTTPGVANIILLVIAFVFFLITLCLALKILKHHYKSTNNQPRSIKLNEYPKKNGTTQVSDQPNQHPDTTQVSHQPNQHPENDLLQIHVGKQTFPIPKNDVSLTDLLETFNEIILLTADHIKLDADAKRAIMKLRLIINQWEIKAMQQRIRIVESDDILQDSISLQLFDLVLPALSQVNEL